MEGGGWKVEEEGEEEEGGRGEEGGGRRGGGGGIGSACLLHLQVLLLPLTVKKLQGGLLAVSNCKDTCTVN